MRLTTNLGFFLALSVSPGLAHGFQETDITQTPNAANAGIKKSLTEQIGAGQGDTMTPGSSAFIIARDPFRAIARGRQLFQRKFTVAQGFGPRTGDGVGDIMADGSIGAGLSDSCAACHGRPQGSAGFGGDVFTRPASRDAPHLFGLGLQEMLGDEMTSELRATRAAAIAAAQSGGSPVVTALSAKGVGFGSITAFPDGSVDTSAVEGVDADLRIRPFFAQGGTISMREFLVGAFNAEMGLEAADPILAAAAAGADVTTPSGMLLSGSMDAIEGSPAAHAMDDPDLDGVLNEIDPALVDFMEFYLLNYFKPGIHDDDDDEDLTASRVVTAGFGSGETFGLSADDSEARGLRLFKRIGCNECHVQSLTIDVDRRVADVDTRLDFDAGNPFNNLFSTATGLFTAVDDGSIFPDLKVPLGGSFEVDNFFADLKRHDLGPNFYEENFDGTVQMEFITEPLWGVGSTAPYGHDGRSPTLEDVILRHGGEAQSSRDEFADLSANKRGRILDFLGSLVLFSPPATASNLEPKDEANPDFPMKGHGSIALTVLFNDPSDKE